MPDLLEHMYCSQQINIPPNLPFILKQYAKAAIRTQPHDLLYWSAAYFKAKANNSPPPVKERLEYPPIDTASRLSPGFLKVLHKQLGQNEFIGIETLYEKWLGVCLVKEALDSMLKIGNIHGKVLWLKFVAIAAGYLCQSLTKTMIMICEVITEEPEGGSAMIPVEIFVPLYEFLARLECGPNSPHSVPPDDDVESAVQSQLSISSINQGSPKQRIKLHGHVITEKDSTAGLMVWDDLKSEEEQDRVQTPKHSDEKGASSLFGVEVLDDAKGPVTEVVTIFSPKKPMELQSEVSIPAPSSLGSQIGESILSHSSLKENEGWIKVEPQKVDEEVLPAEQTIKDSDIPAEAAESEKAVTDEDETITSENQDDVAGLTLESVKSAKMSPEESKHGEPSASDIASQPENLSGSVYSPKDAHSEPQAETETHELLPPQDSALDLKESVTVQHFVKDDNAGSIVSYSTDEIRKGVFGDKSGDKIERASSENTVKAAETVHKIGLITDESSQFIEQEKSIEENLREDKSSSQKELSQQDSKSFIVLPQEEFWQHVPGIGPVIPEPQILAVVEYMQYWATKQHGMVMPRNITHILCPSLDLPLISEDEDDKSFY